MDFEDNFSKQAATYAQHRPRYPEALFSWLASIAPGNELAWDCATGNGQAAHCLAACFDRVIATDASAEQIANAEPHPRIEYRVATAESSGIEAGSADLITVATALHWFDIEAFYQEARRVLRPGGVVAAWVYSRNEIDRTIDPLLQRYAREIVGPYWSERITLVNEEYRTISFPFEEIQAPRLAVEVEWSLDDLLGYLESWSSTQKFKEVHGSDPLDQIRDDLATAWGPAETRRLVRGPLHMRVGRMKNSR
jgi:ubiquinone/menaquinone biosynthesis C-methylase UbiE